MSSQFVYSTPYNDMARYNTVYSRLVNLYGLPVSYNNAGTTLSALLVWAEWSVCELEFLSAVHIWRSDALFHHTFIRKLSITVQVR